MAITFNDLAAAVALAKSEQSQVNGVAKVLAAMGYGKAASPEVHQTTVDRSTFRIYLWRNSPFNDHLILATGPSFVPKLSLAADVKATPGVGFYVHALVAKDTKTLTGAAKAAAKGSASASTSASEARSSASSAAAAKRRAEADARATAKHRADAEAEARSAEYARRAAAEQARLAKTRKEERESHRQDVAADVAYRARLDAARASGRDKARASTQAAAEQRARLDAARLSGREKYRAHAAQRTVATTSTPSQADREAALAAKLLALLG